MYLAYKYVGLAVLLAEANFNAERLNLPMQRPIQESQLTHRFVHTPTMARQGESGGRIDAGGYSFAEGGRRPYHVIIKLDRDGYAAYPYGWLPMAERNEKLAHEKSDITTNEAYQLAVGWLKAIDVDVLELEKTHKVGVQQRWFWSRSQAATKVPLPLFDVKWGKWDDPKVNVSIDGRTREFVELRQGDGSFSKRPAELLRYVDELLAIPDDEFRKYSPVERSNLVARFAMNWPVVRQEPKYLAYKYVGLAALLAEANFNAERLDLPFRHPIQESELVLKSILDPNIYHYFGGRVDAGGYNFCERDRSRCRLLAKEESLGKNAEELLHSKPLITTNEAYQLAVAALKAIDVDVHKLEKTNKVEVRQQVWSGRDEVVSPIFEVHWGKWDEPKIVAIVNGKEKQVTFLKQNDLSFSKRPTELIRNRDVLLAIPDEEFQKYSLVEKSNLVVRFAANYPLAIQAGTNLPAVSPNLSSPNTMTNR